MRVVHTVASLRSDHGGPSRSVCALASAEAEQGCEPVIVSMRRDGEPEPIHPAHPAVGIRLAPRPGRGVLQWHRPTFKGLLNEELRAGMPLVLHDHGLWLSTNHFAARTAARSGVPRIVSPRGMLSDWALRHRGARKRLAWMAYQRRDLSGAAVVHATSEEEVEEVRRLGLRQPIALIPNGVEPPSATPTVQRGEQRRALFLSRIHPKKGLVNLVRAWGEIRPESWELVIAGPDEGGHREEVERAARACGVSDVSFPGPIGDEAKWDLYRSADIFILPTFSENFGLVVAEALAAGVPVITTKAAPWSELVAERCGWWVDVGVESLVSALRDALATTREELRAMGHRGRQLVERKYGWSGIAAEMIRVYEWMLGSGERPPCMYDHGR